MQKGEGTTKSVTLSYSFGHISARQWPIWEANIPLENPKCPLKNG